VKRNSFGKNTARLAALLLVCSCTSGIGTAQTKVVGYFESETRYASATWSIAAGDFNGDGRMDFVASSDNTIVVFLGNGDGTFQSREITMLHEVFTSTALCKRNWMEAVNELLA
jgi:hypothetical protein